MAKLNEYNGHYCESQYEYAFIDFLEQEGWTYTAGNTINRRKSDVLLQEDLISFIKKTEPTFIDDDIQKIYDSLRLVGSESDFATLHKVYGWLVNGIQFTPQNQRTRIIILMI